MINWITGTVMSVPADLVEKYKAAGHRLAAAPETPEAESAKPARKPRKPRASGPNRTT